jgi:hypothetical protein
VRARTQIGNDGMLDKGASPLVPFKVLNIIIPLFHYSILPLFHHSSIPSFHYSWLDEKEWWGGILYYQQFVEVPIHLYHL